MAGTKSGHDQLDDALLSVGPALGSVPRIFQRGEKILFAFAFESFLGGFETCHPHFDFFALLRQSVLQFGHAHPPFDSVPTSIGVRDWGTNWDTALQDCDCDVGNAMDLRVRPWRWIKPEPRLWLAHLPDSHGKTAREPQENGSQAWPRSSGFTEHRRTRKLARSGNRKAVRNGRGAAGRNRGRTGKIVPLRQAGEEIANASSDPQGQKG
jgi:hypothetical protein